MAAKFKNGSNTNYSLSGTLDCMTCTQLQDIISSLLSHFVADASLVRFLQWTAPLTLCYSFIMGNQSPRRFNYWVSHVQICNWFTHRNVMHNPAMTMPGPLPKLGYHLSMERQLSLPSQLALVQYIASSWLSCMIMGADSNLVTAGLLNGLVGQLGDGGALLDDAKKWTIKRLRKLSKKEQGDRLWS